MNQSRKDPKGTFSYIGLGIAWGTEITVALLVGYYLGVWLSGIFGFGSAPKLIIPGILLTASLTRIVKRYNKFSDDGQ